MRRLLSILLTVCLITSAFTAWAYWTAGSAAGGNGAAAVTSVNQGATPTASAAGNAVTVAWAATTLTIGQPVTGYTVKRYSGSTAQTILTACTGTIAGTSCVESNVPTGVWTYSVTPVFATNWVGFESAKSSNVVVGNVAPVAVADSYSVAEDAVLTVGATGVLGNDSDANNDPLTAILYSGVANGALTFNANGGFIYTPNPAFNGSDSFSYKANDGTQNSNLVTVALTVAGVNDAPVNSVPGPQQTPKNTNRVFSAATNNPISISDVDAGGANVQVQLNATNGTVNLADTTGLTFSGNGTAAATFTGTIANINLRLNGAYFTPTSTFTGAATLQIVTSDLGNTGTGGTLTATNTVTINVNSLGIFTANQDIGAPSLAGSSTYSGAVNGTYTVKGSGADIWTPPDQFQYLYRDLPGDGRLTAKVSSSTQSGGNNTNAKAGVMFRETTATGSKQAMMNLMQTAGTEFMFRVTADQTPATSGAAALVVAPYWIRITRVGNMITGEYSPDGVTWTTEGTAQAVAMASIKVGLAVTSHDNLKLSTVTYDNVALTTPPTAAADVYTTNENATLTVAARGVLANDTDPESDALTAVLVSGTTGLTLNANGSFTYVPPANFTGTTSFTYKANDGVFDSTSVTVTLTVNPHNAAPSFIKGANQSVTRIVGAQAVAGWATAISQGTGDSGQLVDFVVTNTNNPLFSVQPAVSAAGTLTYTLTGTAGVATASVTIHDNGGTANGGSDTSAVQTFTIPITDYSSAVSGDFGLVSYWRLGEALATSPMDDITATNNNGTYGTPTMGVAGAIAGDSDTAVQFGGASPAYATAARQLGGNFSFEFWVKSTQNFSNNYSSPACTLWWQGASLIDADASGGANDFGISLCSGKIIAGVGATTGDVSIATSGTYNNGSWHQVVFTRTQSSGAMALYVDGAAAGTATGSVNALTSAPTLNFGRSTRGDNYFAGTLDEVSLYNTVLSGATVTNHYLLATSVADVTGPTGGSVDASGLVGTGSRYASSTTLSLVLAKGTDPSGVATSGNLLKRATATLTSGGTADGTCGAFGSYSTVSGGTDPVSPKSDAVSDQACYSYQYVVKDTLGNSTTYTSPGIKVDLTAPAAPTLAHSAFTNSYSASGATVYYRSAASSGSFTTTSTATDTGSGIVSYAFPALGTNWTSTPGALGVNTYSWSGAPAAPGTKAITATNNATSVSGGTSFTPTADDSAPSAGSVTPPNGTQAGTSVSVAFTTGTDGGSGLGTRLLQRQSAPLTATCGSYGGWTTVTNGTNPASSPFTDTAAGGFCYKYQYLVSDNVGNTNTASSGNVVTVTLASSTVKAQYKNLNTLGSQWIVPGLQLINTSSSTVDLSAITVRYWFTRDNGASTFGVSCWSGPCGTPNPSVTNVSSRTGADAYLQLGFSSGTLAAGGATGEMMIGVNKDDWSNFIETDDYSYGTGTTYADSTTVTVYQNGILIWGTEPT
jgi:hypothetical protein